MAKPGAHANSQQSAPMRWVFVGICGLLSLVLAGSMLSNFFGARQLADTVIRGQAAMVFHLLHRYAPPSVRQPSDEEVERAFEAGQDLGLRYLALVDRKGAVMEIGESSEDIVFEALPPTEYRLVGDVVRVWAPQGPRPLLEGKGPPPFEGKWGGEGSDRRDSRGRDLHGSRARVHRRSKARVLRSAIGQGRASSSSSCPRRPSR